MFTLVCAALGAFGHWLASGHQPPVSALLVAAALVYVLARGLAGRERSLAEITFGVLATQLCLHVVLAVTGPATRHSASVDSATMEGHSGLLPWDWMAVAHLAAGFAAAWWLRWGEAMVWALCSWLAVRVAGPVRWLFAAPGGGPVLPRLRRAPAAWSAPLAASGLLTRHTITRRGPPPVFLPVGQPDTPICNFPPRPPDNAVRHGHPVSTRRC